jgi:predicted nuclease of restriction endonuclease-like RecB superfamily
VEQLAAEYNRRALETLLVRTVSADLLLPKPNGPAIKRFYFLMKRSGLLADLEMAAGGVRAHLFGPLEVFGPRTRHGDRFARAIVQLLRWMPELGGSARVLVNEKEYALALDGAGTLLASVADPAADDDGEEEAGEATQPGVTAIVAEEASGVQFDSGIEERLYVTLRGMARRGDARGWTIEREPEPLVQDGVVLVPDFALTRGSGGAAEQKVYVEVIGFWTPAYRQRKRQKLSLLSGSVPLLLIVQEQLAGDFHGLPFVTLTYRQRPSAADLIRLVERTYGRSDARQADAAKRLGAVWGTLDKTVGVVSADALREQLGLAPSDDLRALWERSDSAPPEGWRWAPGLGLCHDSWLGALTEIIAPLVAGTGEEGVALERVRRAVEASSLPAACRAGDQLDAALPLLGFEVVWASLFEATVRRLGPAGA